MATEKKGSVSAIAAENNLYRKSRHCVFLI